MKIEYYSEYSNNLNRNMEYKIYGHAGDLLLVFPCQNGRFYDFEDNKMIEVLSFLIDSGKYQVVCVDSIDAETFSSNGNPRWRIEQHERYYHYIMDELIGSVRYHTNNHHRILTTGCSMGAFHALNFFLRRPDVFNGVVALSGVYDASFFFGDYMDELVCLNSPIKSLPNMDNNHPYLDMYRHSDIILCVGQGAWEDEMLHDTKIMERIFKDKNIDCWIDYWGLEVNHDWPWWRKQLPYFLNIL